MIRKTTLLLLILLLSLSACSARPGTLPPPAPPGTGAEDSAIPATPLPVIPLTPVPTATQTPLPPDLPAFPSPELIRIDFQDENSGWAVASNAGGRVLRTVDGGVTWLNATPPQIGAVGYSASLVVLNTSTVWVLVPSADFFSATLYRTGDGGITWSFNPVPFGIARIQFLDARTGRALADRGAAAGSQAVELFQTSDGGVTWTSVFYNDPNQSGSSDSLPPAGIKNGMTFTDANTGWVTGSTPAEGDIFLYVTHDGGISWSQQSLPLPAGYGAYQYMPQVPIFFGMDGLLPLTVYLNGSTVLTFYFTHDGGASWSGDLTGAGRSIQPGMPAFADALHGWCWDGGAVLFYSTDGAQKWSNAAASLDLSGRLAQLEFVPASAGLFTGWALSQADEAGHSQLYRTTDGVNWTPLIP